MSADWRYQQHDRALSAKLAGDLDINPITAQVMINRGIISSDAAKKFLFPNLSDVEDPMKLPDIENGAKRIADAISKGEIIAIFGDYDADGITATAMLAQFLIEVGARVIAELPNRMDEGYGITASAIDRLHAKGAAIIITVDNGSRSVKEVEYANSLGMTVIVTDHHGMGQLSPPAYSIINPQLMPVDSPSRNLAGVGVAFMFAAAIRRVMRDRGTLPNPEPNLKRHLDLVAIGTIADVVSLTGSNRILARFGLSEIAISERLGIKALLRSSGLVDADGGGLVQNELGSHSIAFRLAPRINAAGRMGSPMTALNLLLSDTFESSEKLAHALELANRERQLVEERILALAIEQIERKGMRSRSGLVLHSKGWHVGVIGIVAAKITERYRLPTVIVSTDKSPSRGSARCFGGIDLVEALSACSKHLIKFGGHSMAAGLSIDPAELDGFAESFDATCGRLIPKEGSSDLLIDCELHPADISKRLVDEIAMCRPFGMGNPEPLFSVCDCDILERRIVGDNHLKLKIKKGTARFDAIGFGMADQLKSDTKKISIACTPQLNVWQGVTSVQLKIKEFKAC